MKNKQKKVFIWILIFFSIVLMFLPFVVTINDLLTRIIQKNLFYLLIQNYIVPIEAKMIGVLVGLMGYKYSYYVNESIVLLNGIPMQITWNCLGWQSLLLLMITFVVGFGKRYKLTSIIESILIGFLGTFWINILRMLTTMLLAVHLPSIFRVVYHDYLAAFTSLIWLFLFWWFAYKYVLEERTNG